MSWAIAMLLVTGAICAAAGQVMFKLGATGHENFAAFINGWTLAGLLAYGGGTVIWIYALSKVPLTVVYPFTVLTFVLVYAVGLLVLKEPYSWRGLTGVALILIGLFLTSSSQA